MATDPQASELFSTKMAAAVLNRTSFCMWYHATRNIEDPIRIDDRIYLTKTMLRGIVEQHLRLKPGETVKALLHRIDAA